MSPHFLVHPNKTLHTSVITREHANGNLREGPLQMAGQERTCLVCLCKALLGPSLDLLITYTAFTCPFPEAMHSLLMVTLLSFFGLVFFFFQWMRTEIIQD